jgi:putative hydrolase of the HAD superfamily
MVVKGVFFDVYGTLLVLTDAERAWADWSVAFYETFRRYGLDWDRDAFLSQCLSLFDAPAPALPEAGLTLYETRIMRFGEGIGFRKGMDCVRETAACTVNAWHQYVVIDPDAISVLERLREDRTLAVVSNFDHPQYLRSVLEEMGLTPFFSSIVISGEVGIEKPKAEIFRIALQQTGLFPHEVVHVGDSTEDVAGATAAGCQAVQILRDGNAAPAETPPARVILRLTELIHIL